MQNFQISVKKLTDSELMREACEMTFLGNSRMKLLGIYKSEHSPARTQLFWVKFEHIPLFISTHLLRHHVGSVPYQLTCRDDREGANPMLKDKIKAINESLSDICKSISNGVSSFPECESLNNIMSNLSYIAETSDRYTPVNLGLLLNAQSLIDMSKLRLCFQAHKETILVFQELKRKIAEVDPELAACMVRKCVYRNGLCGEPRCCGFNSTPAFQSELEEYLSIFSNKQKGIKNESN